MTTCEVVIPSAEFLHPCAGGFGTGLGNARHGPCHVPEISRVTRIALGAMAGETHAGKIFGGFGFLNEIEQHRGHAVFTIVVMVLNPRIVIAVWNGTFAFEETQKFQTAFDRNIHFRIIDPGFFGENQRCC